jgi:peptidoglycan/LPS O-acetylase OafA/YrhL
MLRGLAALMVLVSHASRLTPPASSAWPPAIDLLGQAGVVLFFVLSGYLVGGMWVDPARRRPVLRRYLLRRFSRIWPAYAVAFTVSTVLLYPAGRPWWQWAVHLGLVHNWVPGQYAALFPVGWTLGIEAAFYLVAPLLPATASRLAGVWLLSTCFAVAGGLIAPSVTGTAGLVGPLRYTLLATLSMFCPGMLIAINPGPLRWLRLRAGLLLLTFVNLLVLALALNWLPMVWARDLRYQALAAAFGLLVDQVVHGGGVAERLREWPRRLACRAVAAPLAALGTVSYGLYLWNFTVVYLLRRQGVYAAPGAGAWPIDILAVVAVTIPVAILSWFLIERPALAATGGSRRGPSERTRRGRALGAPVPGEPELGVAR